MSHIYLGNTGPNNAYESVPISRMLNVDKIPHLQVLTGPHVNLETQMDRSTTAVPSACHTRASASRSITFSIACHNNPGSFVMIGTGLWSGVDITLTSKPLISDKAPGDVETFPLQGVVGDKPDHQLPDRRLFAET